MERTMTNLPDAQRLTTTHNWDDLVLDAAVRGQVDDIVQWVRHQRTVGAQAGRGHVCLFHGPAGSGKTLTAALIGKATGLAVYRIDLAQIASKYVGETQKQLARMLDAAAQAGAILVFDEADALFGKRTDVKDSHDRYANIEVAYLLQRIETYPGVVILTTNLRSAIDDAFARRFQTVIHFPPHH
jgi:SpoVK/Ycf46/Vps4 family AAA+-type ATPase